MANGWREIRDMCEGLGIPFDEAGRLARLNEGKPSGGTFVHELEKLKDMCVILPSEATPFIALLIAQAYHLGKEDVMHEWNEAARATARTEAEFGDKLGTINGVTIFRYDVVQVSRDSGKTWNDYASIKEPADILGAAKLFTGTPSPSDKVFYRIRRNSNIVFC